ncbi:MAG: stage III sporulation protein AG [Clostridia bacterium]|nr:stage III sporulation protein AG [Clostridia bacterium]
MGRNWEKWRAFFTGGRMIGLVTAAGMLGVVLIALSGFLSHDSAPAVSGMTTQQYVEQLEEKLCRVISRIDGAGECSVMITLENGVEYLYATEGKTGSSRAEKSNGSGSDLTQADTSQDSVILIDTGNGKQGLLVTEIQPTVKGVVVVCAGGDRPAVQQRVTQAVTTVLHISSSRVCVTK